MESFIQKGLKVLLVDDDEMIRRVLSEILSNLGLCVVTASGGSEALDLFAGGGIGLTLTDRNMREMDGVELTRRIKQLSREHPVVMVSGMTEVNNGGSENLADAFLAKPFSQDQVIQALRAALDNF
jgi:CheY-like chemotaxis protein